jgi:hypothetical protein
MASINDFSIGEQVNFGRHNGEQTLGTIVGKGRSKLKVRQDESRGTMKSHKIGTIWTVPPNLCQKVNGSASATPAPVTAPSVRVGQPVTFEGYDWLKRSKGTVTGVVTQVSPQGIEVYGPQGTQFLQASQVTAAAKRIDVEVMEQIQGVYCGLSPENISCDGESSRAQVVRLGARLRRALKALFVELGREVTESEAYGIKPYAGETTPVTRNRSAYAPATACGFRVGDKVAFDAKGQTVVGYVTRVSQKTLSVLPVGETNPRAYWRVSPRLLWAA